FACALHQANKHKKSGRAFAYPQNRESKPYTHKQETPLPHMRKGIYTVFVVRVKFSTFVLH
ncbi:MAG: hypothetical protein ACLULI_24685, partial [Bacteroides caccae]